MEDKELFEMFSKIAAVDTAMVKRIQTLEENLLATLVTLHELVTVVETLQKEVQSA